MPLPRYAKGASALQKRYRLSKIFEDIFDNPNPLYTYGGYYDIVVQGGAESIAGDPPMIEGDPIGRLVQLVPAASGSDVTFVDMNDEVTPREMTYRTEATYSTGFQYTDKPVMFYPDGHFDGLFTPDGQGGYTVSATPQLNIPVGDFNVPQGTVIEEYTVALAGAKLLHELGLSQSDVDALLTNAGSGDTASALGIPVPDEPGVLLITVGLDGSRIPVIRTYVDGVEVSTAQAGAIMPTDPVPPGEGLNMNDFFMYLGMPCWGTQKLLAMSRALTQEEAINVSNRMLQTIRVRA